MQVSCFGKSSAKIGQLTTLAPLLVAMVILVALWPSSARRLDPQAISFQGCTNVSGGHWQAVLLVTNTLPYTIECWAYAFDPNLFRAAPDRETPVIPASVAGWDFDSGVHQLGWHEAQQIAPLPTAVPVPGSCHVRIESKARVRLLLSLSPGGRNELVVQYTRRWSPTAVVNSIKQWLNRTQTWRRFEMKPPECQTLTTREG